jgi:hypothetical protein
MEKKKVNMHVDHGGHSFFTDNVTISHGPNKFVMDFSQTTPRFDNVGGGMQRTLFVRHNAIMMDPVMAKIFLQTLQGNVKNYEKKFGKIGLPKRGNSKGKSKGGKKLKSKSIAQSVESSSRYIG